MHESLRVLIITHQWPPVGGSGVQRGVKLAKYLARAGVSVHVLTAAHPRYSLMDPTLCEDVPADVTVHRVSGWDPASIAGRMADVARQLAPNGGKWSGLEDRVYWRASRLTCRLGTVEHEKGWVRAAVKAAAKVIRDHAIDAVVTTSPPHSVQHVGAQLAKDTNIPWIADIRDPITGHFAYSPRSLREDQYWRQIEWAVIRHARRVVVTCDDLARDWAERLEAVPGSMVSTITNGFDPEDRPARRRADDGKFRLTHVGRFYRQQSIKPLLAAIRQVRARRPEAAALELHIVGAISSGDRANLLPEDKAFIREQGYLTHHAALGELADADALFLMTPGNAGGRLCIPGKTFEYLAFGGPIVALVHPGTHAGELLREQADVECASHDYPNTLARVIERQLDGWLARTWSSIVPMRNTSAFEWSRLAANYVEVLRAAIAGVDLPSRVEPEPVEYVESSGGTA